MGPRGSSAFHRSSSQICRGITSLGVIEGRLGCEGVCDSRCWLLVGVLCHVLRYCPRLDRVLDKDPHLDLERLSLPSHLSGCRETYCEQSTSKANSGTPTRRPAGRGITTAVVFCSFETKREMFSRMSLVLRDPSVRILPSPTAATCTGARAKGVKGGLPHLPGT